MRPMSARSLITLFTLTWAVATYLNSRAMQVPITCCMAIGSQAKLQRNLAIGRIFRIFVLVSRLVFQ